MIRNAESRLAGVPGRAHVTCCICCRMAVSDD